LIIGGEKEEKTIIVQTVFKLACKNINRWNPGGVAPGGFRSITLILIGYYKHQPPTTTTTIPQPYNFSAGRSQNLEFSKTYCGGGSSRKAAVKRLFL
jgi:hypothetical protein